MNEAYQLLLESGILSALNISAVYLAAFTYHLSWAGVLCVMITVSVITAYLTRLISLKVVKSKMSVHQFINDGLAIMIMAFFTTMAVFVILIYRFNLPMALGISLLSGILSTLLRKFVV